LDEATEEEMIRQAALKLSNKTRNGTVETIELIEDSFVEVELSEEVEEENELDEWDVDTEEEGDSEFEI